MTPRSREPKSDRKSKRRFTGRPQTRAQVSYYQRLKDSFTAFRETHPEYAGSLTTFRRLMLQMKWAPPVHGPRPVPAKVAERQRRFLEEGLGRVAPTFRAIYSPGVG